MAEKLSPTEEPTTEEAVVVQRDKLKISVLEAANAARMQNGLRHGDYRRYRQYCARKLRRLRKSKLVQLQHGRGKNFVRKFVTAENALTDRHLHILLFNAERGWGYAMELKQDAMEEDSPDIHRHAMRRLRKAMIWSENLRLLCVDIGDDRTILETTAYAGEMRGLYHLEREEWKLAMDGFFTAEKIYRQLGGIGDECSGLFLDKVEELEPSLRYCRYNIGEDTSAESLASLQRSGAGPSFDLLQAKLDAVIQADRKAAASTLEHVSWRGEKVSLRYEDIRVGIHSILEKTSELTRADADLPGALMTAKEFEGSAIEASESVETLVLESFRRCDSTLQAISAKQVELLGEAGGQRKKLTLKACAMLSDLEWLEGMIRERKLWLQFYRNKYLALMMAASTSVFSTKAEDFKQVYKPRDVMQMFDRVLQGLAQLEEVATSPLPPRSGGKKGAMSEDASITAQTPYLSSSAKLIAAHMLSCQCWKVLFAAVLCGNQHKYPEGGALCSHCVDMADNAIHHHRAVETDLEILAGRTAGSRDSVEWIGNWNEHAIEKEVQRLDVVSSLARREKCIFQAHHFLLKSKTASDSKDPLVEAVAALKLSQEAPRSLEALSLPPSIAPNEDEVPLLSEPTPIPVKPLFFDIANSHLQMPDLSSRIKTKKRKAPTAVKEEPKKGGWFGGWF